MIATLTEVLDFCDVEKGYFVITAANDILKLSYDGGDVTNIEITDGTYEGTDLATELQGKINSAFTISSIVSYDTTTKKFTITVSAEHTIAYTNLSSDAGLTFGFNKDHSAALSITSNLAAGDPSAILASIQNGVENWIADKCRRIFESDDYSEYYSGDGGKLLQLNNYPITALIRVCIGRRWAIRVKNTSTYTSATVSVNSTGLIFTKDDISNSDITFAENATMADIVTAINALDSWSAEIENSDYSNFKSSELVRMFGKNAIHNNYIYLEMSEEATDDFEVNPDRGILYRGNDGWPEGENNIFVKYTAGYSTMPERLKLGVKISCKHIYQKRKEELFGVLNYGIGDIRVTIETKDLPKEALDIINKFRRKLV